MFGGAYFWDIAAHGGLGRLFICININVDSIIFAPIRNRNYHGRLRFSSWKSSNLNVFPVNVLPDSISRLKIYKVVSCFPLSRCIM
jgi:hypothetical protein